MNIEQIALLHNFNIDITTKTIVLSGEINDELAIATLKNLHILNQSNGMITIYLNTEGGSIPSARIIYDSIKNSSNRIRIVCWGEIYSAGTIILMAGDDRIMTNNSNLMTHSGEQSIADHHPNNLERWVEQMKIESSFMNKAYLERINEKRKKDKKKYLTEQDISANLIWDTFYTPKEALALGLITEIGFIL